MQELEILISIQPNWTEQIAQLIKTIEVRRNSPTIKTPFKCRIYETKGRYIKFIHGAHTKYGYGCGKVIGEFVCDSIDKYDYCYCDHPELGYDVGYDCGDNWYDIDDEDLQKTCLTQEEFKKYGKGKPLYGWHITDLKIYDKPKELSEFSKPCKIRLPLCDRCEYYSIWNNRCENITRPPQSWCYVRVGE